MIDCGLISVLIPAYEEEPSIADVVENVRSMGNWREVVVVDDGSTDRTSDAAARAGARVVRHPYNKGNGAAVKTAIREARGDYILLMDADGQHSPDDINKIISLLSEYDLVVGARSWNAQATFSRGMGNAALARFASFLSGFPIPDLTSGFRAARRGCMAEFLHMFPNGFSYPTTSTLAFLKAGYDVAFVPIEGKQRTANTQSKMRPWREGIRFLMIILRMITLFSPLRVFLPVSALFFFLGFGYMVYTIATEVHVTNTSVLLITASVFFFLFGLISEQISMAMFRSRRLD